LNSPALSKLTARRGILRAGSILAGAGLLAELMPQYLSGWPREMSGGPAQPLTPARSSQGPGSAPDRLAQQRASAANTTLQTLRVRDNIYMISGPGSGGNILVLDGPEGKVMVDASYVTVAAKLKQAIDALGGAPVKLLINTHWHFDHTDGNAPIHDAGALILAHENTRQRLSTPQYMAVFDAHFPAAPAAGLPQQTFRDDLQLHLNSEDLALSHFSPAHTDSDIYIHYEKGNVLHMGDIWFNGFYPVIDASTRGNINGMIAAASKGLVLADAETKIVPGHGPLGDKAALIKYRDMLTTVRDRLQTLKASGKSLQEATDAKPTADFDPAWGNGLMKPEAFVKLVYTTL
jgi:cyclase